LDLQVRGRVIVDLFAAIFSSELTYFKALLTHFVALLPLPIVFVVNKNALAETQAKRNLHRLLMQYVKIGHRTLDLVICT